MCLDSGNVTKLQFDGRQFKLTLPKKILEALGWEKGDEVVVELELSGGIGGIGGIVLRNRSSAASQEGYRKRGEERIEYAR
ncbi:AbrB/MazE/SpoVT family DNA-binding domain-containing protein [Candidatus Woesearchaeota archaeon]|nr:AbrB/MazE/SpoVT family DNA-binding domain-containing protein [Candidatus Woesearchaeota archaeon]